MGWVLRRELGNPTGLRQGRTSLLAPQSAGLGTAGAAPSTFSFCEGALDSDGAKDSWRGRRALSFTLRAAPAHCCLAGERHL